MELMSLTAIKVAGGTVIVPGAAGAGGAGAVGVCAAHTDTMRKKATIRNGIVHLPVLRWRCDLRDSAQIDLEK
jgi:hypothetical protein